MMGAIRGRQWGAGTEANIESPPITDIEGTAPACMARQDEGEETASIAAGQGHLNSDGCGNASNGTHTTL